METKTKHSQAGFFLRLAVATILLAGIIAGIYWVAYRSYPVVADWVEAEGHEAFSLDGEIWYRVGKVGDSTYAEKDYPAEKNIGRVADDGAATRAESDGTPDISRDHAYLLYRVEGKSEVLLMLEPDGSYGVYLCSAGKWKNPDKQDSFVYKGQTYEQIGASMDYSSIYGADTALGFVSADASSEPAGMYSVKNYPYLLVVECENGQQYLYCRKGSKAPHSLVERN